MDSQKHNQLFSKGCSLLEGQVLVESGDGTQPPKVEIDKVRIEEGISCLQQATDINPSNWSAFWMIGKAYQVLGDREREYNAFKKAQKIILEVQPDDAVAVANVLRELGYACIKLNKFTESVYYGSLAMEFDQNDSTLISNYAAALFFTSQLDVAEKYCKKALEKLPGDIVAKNLLDAIQRVRKGEIKQPTTYDELAER